MPSVSSPARRVLPMTGLDKLIVGSFATFLVIGIFVDWINTIAPANGGITLETMHEYSWPPAPMYHIYFWWCDLCDPILQFNPLWIKYLSMLSPLVFCPFYVVAIFAIVTRREWIRLPIVIYSSILFVDLSAFFVEAIWGEVPSPNIWAFTAGYIYYQVFPIIAIARFWKDHPFTVDPLCERAKIAPKKAQ